MGYRSGALHFNPYPWFLVLYSLLSLKPIKALRVKPGRKMSFSDIFFSLNFNSSIGDGDSGSSDDEEPNPTIKNGQNSEEDKPAIFKAPLLPVSKVKLGEIANVSNPLATGTNSELCLAFWPNYCNRPNVLFSQTR